MDVGWVGLTWSRVGLVPSWTKIRPHHFFRKACKHLLNPPKPHPHWCFDDKIHCLHVCIITLRSLNMSFHGFPSIFSCLICKTSYFKPLCCFFQTTPVCIFYPRIIHSRLIWFFPVWNDLFQTKLLDHGKCSISWQWKEIGKKFFQVLFI